MVADAALRELGLNYDITIIGNVSVFPDYNIVNPPALVVDGKIVVEGHIPTFEKMREIFMLYNKV